MITLLLDSSNIDLAVGIANEDKLIDSTIYEAWQVQSEYMVKEIDLLFKKYEISRNDIKDIMVSIGPGSYTGVRIALTIAKVMALALNISIYAVSSLHVLKNGDLPSICLMNARSGRSYIGVYQGNNCIIKDQVMKNDEVLNYISSHPGYAICGDVSYLSLEGYKSNVINEMLSLKSSAAKYENILDIKPVYLKD